MGGIDDLRLLDPLVLSGPAVERDKQVKDKNNSPKPNEEIWIENAKEQAEDESKSQVEFFDTLRKNMNK